MKIQTNNSRGCRETAAEVTEAWGNLAVIQVLKVISKAKKIEARFH